MNIYILKLSRMTIKFCWKINPSFCWYAALSPLLPSSDTLPLCYIAQVHSSSGHKHSLKEVLSDPAASVRLADTKVSIHTGLLTGLIIRELYCTGYS